MLRRTAVALVFAAMPVTACAGPVPSPGAPAATSVSSAPGSPSATAATESSTSTAIEPPATTVPPPSDAPSNPPITPVPVEGDGLLDRLVATVNDATGGRSATLVADVADGSAQLDGFMDDGQGPGRLFVVASPPGTTARGNLCLDRDFVQGATCERVELASGDVAFRRGLVDVEGVQTVTVAVRLADGSGVLVESGNFRFEAPPVLVAGEARPTPEITRQAPIFDPEATYDLARAVADAIRGCTLADCP
jgi:hypothetical protein